MKTIRAADLFCGAGGATTGLYQAARTIDVSLDIPAVNHWPVAVDTHQWNHPDVKHLSIRVESVDPRAVISSGHLHLLIAGIEELERDHPSSGERSSNIGSSGRSPALRPPRGSRRRSTAARRSGFGLSVTRELISSPRSLIEMEFGHPAAATCNRATNAW